MASEGWTCADCGTPGAYPVNDSRFGSFASIDAQARYTTGFCDRCSKPYAVPRKANNLIRSGFFDRERFDGSQERAKLTKYAKKFAKGDRVQLGDSELVELVRLYDKHGAPGFYLPSWVRERAEKVAR